MTKVQCHRENVKILKGTMCHRKERWDLSKAETQRTNIKSYGPALRYMEAWYVLQKAGQFCHSGFLLHCSPLWLCFPQQIVHIPGISVSLGSPLHLCLHSNSFPCHCLWDYLMEYPHLDTHCLASWKLGGSLHDSTTLEFFLSVKSVSHEQWQDLASAQAANRFTWIMTLVTSKNLDSWTWWNESWRNNFLGVTVQVQNPRNILFSRESFSDFILSCSWAENGLDLASSRNALKATLPLSLRKRLGGLLLSFCDNVVRSYAFFSSYFTPGFQIFYLDFYSQLPS